MSEREVRSLLVKEGLLKVSEKTAQGGTEKTSQGDAQTRTAPSVGANTSPRAKPKTSPSADAVKNGDVASTCSSSMEFLTKLDTLMAGFEPALPQMTDNMDVLRCVTDWQMRSDSVLKRKRRHKRLCCHPPVSRRVVGNFRCDAG